jgi:hypothetical protein
MKNTLNIKNISKNNDIKNNESQSSLLKVINNEVNTSDYVDIINEAEKNLNFTSLLNNKPYPNISCSSCYNNSVFNSQIISIHTEDRDILKWPLENNFELELPLVVKNVLAIELYDITIPKNYYNISNKLQNTSLWFSIPQYFEEPIELILVSGFYTNQTLVESLKYNLNKVTSNKLYELQVYACNSSLYNGFDISFNEIKDVIKLILLMAEKNKIFYKLGMHLAFKKYSFSHLTLKEYEDFVKLLFTE